MDLTPLMNDSSVHPSDYVTEFIHRFELDITARIFKMGWPGFDQPNDRRKSIRLRL